jgi:recombination protein RecR
VSKKDLNKFYQLVEAFEELPTIGKKSALRLAYHIVVKNNFTGIRLIHSIEEALRDIKQCIYCGSLTQGEVCDICLNIDGKRDNTILCIVQNAKDIFMIEESKHYNGKYFVIDEITDEIISKLIKNIMFNHIEEIIFAITPNLQNDTFILYIEDKLKDFDIKFTRIAQGIPTGVNIENIDILSLSKAIESRVKIGD